MGGHFSPFATEQMPDILAPTWQGDFDKVLLVPTASGCYAWTVADTMQVIRVGLAKNLRSRLLGYLKDTSAPVAAMWEWIRKEHGGSLSLLWLRCWVTPAYVSFERVLLARFGPRFNVVGGVMARRVKA